MVELDRRSFIEGAVATLFAGMAVSGTPLVPIPADVTFTVTVTPPNPDDLWQQIFESIKRMLIENFAVAEEEFNTKWYNTACIFTDSIYAQHQSMQLLMESFMIQTATPTEIEKQQRSLSFDVVFDEDEYKKRLKERLRYNSRDYPL